jgi:hypothetical protein
MNLIQGIVEKVYFKDLGGEDDWGNTHRLSILIGETWVSFGKKKANARGELKVAIKKGAGWEDVTEGDEVAILATATASDDGRTFLNGKTSDIKMVQKGSGATSGSPKSGGGSRGSQTSSAKPSRGNSSGTDWVAKDAGGAASASVDKAIAVLTAVGVLAPGKSWSPEEIFETSLTMQDVVKRVQSNILNADKGEAAFEKAYSPPANDNKPPMTNGISKARGGKPKPVEPDPTDFEDSDIPF